MLVLPAAHGLRNTGSVTLVSLARTQHDIVEHCCCRWDAQVLMRFFKRIDFYLKDFYLKELKCFFTYKLTRL